MWTFAFQITPSFDEANRWVANNGFAVVIALIVILPGVVLFGFLVRGLLSGVASRVDSAVNYFTAKLDALSARQEQSLDKLDDRLSMMTDNSSDNARHIADALNQISATMSALNESNRILLTFMTQNMANVQAHRAVVEPHVTGEAGPSTGVIKPVTGGPQ